MIVQGFVLRKVHLQGWMHFRILLANAQVYIFSRHKTIH